MTASESAAVGIYAVMARDWSDALELISECSDSNALRDLLAMLRHTGSTDTDTSLNVMFIGPVERRLNELPQDPTHG